VNDELLRYYEEWWENPRDPRDHIFRRLNQVVAENLPPGQGKKALDVGSGRGTIVSYLKDKGYRVTAVDLNGRFLQEIKRRYPDVECVEGNFIEVGLNGRYDLVTAIEFIQNLDRRALGCFFEKAAGLTDHLLLSISNRRSLHGFWARRRRFIKDFVHVYTPAEVERLLSEQGFDVVSSRGIGLLTPITLLSGFRLKIIPVWLARSVNRPGERIFPRVCHLYFIEAKKRRKEELKQ
jgi:cyclopropane fatty-acyl-phospholipid synthase-like methyltransferase